MRYVEVMDTTLRDGEQTDGVSFTPDEKLLITKYLLDELNVDAVEVTSAGVSVGDYKALEMIAQWASQNNCLDKIEVLGFVDGTKSVDWIYNAGGRVVNLLTKGSINHLINQLRKTPQQHIDDIFKVVDYAAFRGMKVNVYLEDWSNGMINSRDYVHSLIEALVGIDAVERIMLPDTLGILDFTKTYESVSEIVDAYGDKKRFDFHGHNDYDLAVANSFAAVKAGITRVHTTINGLGERAGNTRLASLVALLNDSGEFRVNVNEKKLYHASKLVESLSGVGMLAPNLPIVGKNICIQNCGVHADGDKKGNLYQAKITPQRFGFRKTQYSLGKTAGKASLEKNLEALGIELDDEQKSKVLERIKELADKKHITTRDDLPFLIADVLGMKDINKVELLDYEFYIRKNAMPKAKVKLKVRDEVYEKEATGNGQYDAFMNAVKKIYRKFSDDFPELVDYTVRIPPGGKTGAIVETSILWKKGNHEFRTTSVDSDQLVAAIKATMRMLNLNGY